MLGGALAVLATGQITVPDALRAINIDVMVFLFGMFIVGEALVESGYLNCISYRLFSWTKNTDQLIFTILFGIGFLSALLMNDTLAIIGTPVVLGLATKFRISPKLLLLSLAFGVTTGSVMSPIGNPQNLLIAVNSGMTTPFVTFGAFLLIPTVLNLAIAWILLRLFYRKEFLPRPFVHEQIAPGERTFSVLVQCSLVIILGLVIVNIVSSFTSGHIVVSLPLIAVCAAAPILIFSHRRFDVLKNIDWCTLVFFAAMFILMASVWQTGFFQSFVMKGFTTDIPVILLTSAIISQFISNVPFVALFQPMIEQAGGSLTHLMALAAGSTIAGNLTILGAASNVIIIQNAEKQGQTLTFLEFIKVGVPLTIIQLLVYAVFLHL
jgi:Na+/H+ antiporter NhaD/arsenite permease-like protein